jgi:hypothetical protein
MDIFEATEQSFKEVMEAIHEFKMISGAKVNMEKSKLIQLDHGERPEWFARSGWWKMGKSSTI